MTPLWQPGHLYLPDDLVQPVSAPAPVNTALANPGFESGVITGWTVTQTGGTGTASVATDKKFVGTYAGRWQGAPGSGYGGGVEAEWINATEAAIVPGRSVSATLYIALDDTSGSQNRGEVRLYWYDASHALLSHSSGTLIRGDNSSFFASTVTATAPAGAAYVRLGAWTTANASGGVRIDAASWSIVAVTTPAGLIYKATQTDPATSASTEPAWPTTVGATVVDGGVTWEAVQASRVEWTASAVMVTGATEPDWPTTVGASVSDGTIEWECISRRVEDPNCPNTTARIIIASKVFATDGDIDRFCATANPLDWTSANDAGYLPTGLQSANANDAAVLAQYRGNLISMNASSFQNWQVDPDPAAMALLDQMEGIGSTWQHAAQPVANDLFFLSKLGVRSVGISAGADNLAAGDIGMPIDVLVQAAMADAETYGTTPLATYYPSAGQYWLAFPETTQVDCSVPTQYDGGQAIPSLTLVNLGSGTGYATFKFATGGVPDKAEVYIGGVLVLDTGWWGDVSHQAQLDTACANLGLTSGAINAIPTPGVTAQQQWNSGEAINFDIAKGTGDTLATVKIYAPMDNTAWKFQLGCPDPEGGSAPTITGDLPDSSVGATGTYSYTVTGAVPRSVTITAGSLPPGATMSAAGVVTYDYTTAGTYSWNVQVEDALGQTASIGDGAIIAEPAASTVDAFYIGGIRQVVAGYSGPAIRVIRLSDSTELDIGFASGSRELDVAALETFGAGTDCEVLKIYKQAGTSNDVQLFRYTDAAFRPQIVVAGVYLGYIKNRVGGHLSVAIDALPPLDDPLPGLTVCLKTGIPAGTGGRYVYMGSSNSVPFTAPNAMSAGWISGDETYFAVTHVLAGTADHSKYLASSFADASTLTMRWDPAAVGADRVAAFFDGVEPSKTTISSGTDTLGVGAYVEIGGGAASSDTSTCELHLESFAIYYSALSDADRLLAEAAL